MGLYVHQMAAFDTTRAQQELKFPAGVEAVTAVAIGYLGDPNSLNDQLKERELAKPERKPQAEFAKEGSF